MKATNLLARLQSLNYSGFCVGEVAALMKIPRATASKALNRLAEAGFVIRLIRGKWILARERDPLAIPALLTAPELTYISLYTALYFHGLISQVPSTVFAVSLGRTRRWKSALGEFSIHHIDADFFFGYTSSAKPGVLMAEPEKALLDVLYLIPARSRLFGAFTEMEFPKSFQWSKSFRYAKRINSPSRRTLVLRKLTALRHEIN